MIFLVLCTVIGLLCGHPFIGLLVGVGLLWTAVLLEG